MRHAGMAVCVIASALGAAAAASAQDRAVYDGWVYDRASGCRVFVPELRDFARATWNGACVDGRADGDGTL